MRMSDGSGPARSGNAERTTGADLVPDTSEDAIPIQPVVGEALAAPTSGQVNAIDPWIRENFVQCPLGEFTVSPRNTPGEILFDLPLGPGLNPYLAHLSAMYSGWVGNLEMQLILAGNAFTAGKVVVALVPPFFPTASLSVMQITGFPHLIIDVRTLEPVHLPLLDVRNVLWHPIREDSNTMRVVCMLYTPLRANSPGDDVFVVSGRLLSRPAADFNFVFLTPPILKNPEALPTVPSLQPGQSTHSRWPNVIYDLLVDASSSVNPQWQNGRVRLDGTLLGTTPVSSGDLCTICASVGARTNQEAPMTLHEPDGNPYAFSDRPAPLGYPDFRGHLRFNWSQTDSTTTYDLSREPILRAPGEVKFYNQAFVDLGNAQNSPFSGAAVIRLPAEVPAGVPPNPVWLKPVWVSQFSDQVPHYTSGAAPPMAPAIGPFLPGEMLLRFRTRVAAEVSTTMTTGLDCALPQEWITHFASSSFTINGDALLLRYRNSYTGVLLFEAKLYVEGFIAVNATTTSQIHFPVDGYFEVVGWVQRLYQLAPVGNSVTGRRVRP